jgi:hypothetical protein
MDIDKFIDDNLDEILDNPTFFISTEQSTEQNTKENKNIINQNIYEDLEEHDNIIDFQDVHEMLEKRKNLNEKEEDNLEIQNEDQEYYFKLINIFMKYYNDKYNKNENLFSNIKDKDKDTNSALELFFEAIMEFKDLKEKLNIENDLLDKYYDSDSNEIVNLMNSYEQVYCLEIIKDNKKIITISLIICLNYILINKVEKWNIFMLKSY